MKPFSRSDRVGQEVQKTLADLLHREIKDPSLAGVTISGVKMAADLKSARVYYMTAPHGAERDKVNEGFKRAKGYVKRELASRLGLRYMPDIKFYYDESFDYGSHIDQLLDNIEKGPGADRSHTEKQ